MAAATDFLREGLERGERLLFVANRNTDEELLALLAGLDGAPALLASGSLGVRSIAKLYAARGHLDRVDQVAAYEALADQALAEGFAGLRVAADMSSLLRTRDDYDRLAAYEMAVDRVMTERPMAALCGYDGAGLAAEARALATVHPGRHIDDDPAFCLSQSADGLRLDGEVDMSNRDLFDAALRVVALVEGEDVRIDVRGLEFIDVRGMAELDRFAARLRAEGRELSIVGASAALERYAGLFGLGHLDRALAGREHSRRS